MPRYDFICPAGHAFEVTLPADDRDKPRTCPKHGVLSKRALNTPLAVLWNGKFHSPWSKKAHGEW